MNAIRTLRLHWISDILDEVNKERPRQRRNSVANIG